MHSRSMLPPLVTSLLALVLASHLCLGQLTTISKDLASSLKVKVITFHPRTAYILVNWETRCDHELFLLFIICGIRFQSSPTPLEATIYLLPTGRPRQLQTSKTCLLPSLYAALTSSSLGQQMFSQASPSLQYLTRRENIGGSYHSTQGAVMHWKRRRCLLQRQASRMTRSRFMQLGSFLWSFPSLGCVAA